jgi:hypothetical protein
MLPGDQATRVAGQVGDRRRVATRLAPAATPGAPSAGLRGAMSGGVTSALLLVMKIGEEMAVQVPD